MQSRQALQIRLFRTLKGVRLHAQIARRLALSLDNALDLRHLHRTQVLDARRELAIVARGARRDRLQRSNHLLQLGDDLILLRRRGAQDLQVVDADLGGHPSTLIAAFGSKARLDSSLRLPDTSGVDSVPSSSLALKRPKFVTPPAAIGIPAAYRRLAEVAHRLPPPGAGEDGPPPSARRWGGRPRG